MCLGISELFSFESTFSMIQVPSATFSLNHSWAKSRWRRLRVICLTHAWLSSSITVGPYFHPMAFKMPRFEMTSDFKMWLTALIYDSAVDVDTLPWSVEHQHITDLPRFPMYEVCECSLSRLPPRSASHWNRNCRIVVIVSMSVGPSCVWNMSWSILLYFQYRRWCLIN